AEPERSLDRLDLCGIGAVQHVEMRPARLLPKGLTQNFRTQARTSHPQQNDVGEPALFDLRCETMQPINTSQFLFDDVQPADPLVLVRSGPWRLVAGPKLTNAAFLAPDLH